MHQSPPKQGGASQGQAAERVPPYLQLPLLPAAPAWRCAVAGGSAAAVCWGWWWVILLARSPLEPSDCGRVPRALSPALLAQSRARRKQQEKWDWGIQHPTRELPSRVQREIQAHSDILIPHNSTSRYQ